MAQINNTDTLQPQEQEFQNVQDIILRHRSKALREVNNENVISAWEVGCFISARLKTAAWGSKTVTQLAEFLRRNDPTLRGFGRRNLYNMVEFFECYTSPEFVACLKRWPMLDKRHEVKKEIVQPVDAQFEEVDAQIVHSVNAQLQCAENQSKVIVQSVNAQIPPIQKFLLDISLTNHVIIFNNCRTMEAKIFYCLYSARERLTTRALQRAIYLEALDRDVRRSNENPSIGMLICQESNRMVVEYAMSRSLSPTMVAEYQRTLTPKETVQRSLDEFVGFVEKTK